MAKKKTTKKQKKPVKKTRPSVVGSKKKTPVKKQDKQQIKILRNFIIGTAVLIVLVILLAFFINSTRNFEYEGVEFNVEKAGDIIFYHTSFPMITEAGEITYNVYLRNDPRKLKDVPFEGKIKRLSEMMVLENKDSFVCDGDGGIAIINFQQILGALGTTIIKDPDAGCDLNENYMFLRIQPGNETSVEKFGPSCYQINVNNCEILEGTERFLVELLVQVQKII